MINAKKSGLFLCLLLCLSIAVGILSGCGSAITSDTTGTENTQTTTSSTEKIKLTLMFAWPSDTYAAKEEELVREKFGDKYDITFKPVDGNIEKTIKTTISSGEPVDLAFYWTDSMQTFVEADMALDLTPYLDAENGAWRNTFIDGTLDKATISGKVYAVPVTPVYPMMVANKDLLDQAGVTLSDTPSWDEFITACETIKTELDIAPFGNSWASWIHRNNLMSIWPDDTQRKAWSEGQISFNDPLVIKALDASAELYDKGYCYPGEGALTVTLDQVKAGFFNKEVAIVAYVNFIAEALIQESGFDNIQILSLPHIGPTTQVMAGGANGYMIPANVKNPEASIEIAKYLTSAEVCQYRVDNAAPVAVKGVTITNPNVAKYAKDAGNGFASPEILKLSSKLSDYLDVKMPANYVFDPEVAINELEALRLEVIG